jgi:hypothetical protein
MSYEIRVTHRRGETVPGFEQILSSEFRRSKALGDLAKCRREFPHCRIVLVTRQGDKLIELDT